MCLRDRCQCVLEWTRMLAWHPCLCTRRYYVYEGMNKRLKIEWMWVTLQWESHVFTRTRYATRMSMACILKNQKPVLQWNEHHDVYVHLLVNKNWSCYASKQFHEWLSWAKTLKIWTFNEIQKSFWENLCGS